MIRVVLLLVVLLSSHMAVGPADAYIGPGAGFAFLSSFLVLIASFPLAILSLLLWPFRLIMNHWRGRDPCAAPASTAW